MDAAEHMQQAGRHLESAADRRSDDEWTRAHLAAAQVHATLAVAAATLDVAAATSAPAARVAHAADRPGTEKASTQYRLDPLGPVGSPSTTANTRARLGAEVTIVADRLPNTE